jgi:hypothetical protein
MNRNIKNPKPATLPVVRCAIYTRKSTEEGLEQEFNSLDAQRESGELFVRSQAAARGGRCLAGPLRRRRLHRRQHGTARPEAADGGHRGGARSTAWSSTKWTVSAGRCSTSPG